MNVTDSANLNNTSKKVQLEKYRKAQFFIRDFFSAEKLENGCFLYKNIVFGFVWICGTIVSLSPKDEEEEKYWINVDDGTSSIQCIIAKKFKELNMSDNTEQTRIMHLLTNRDNNKLEAAALTSSSIKYLDNLVPTIDSLKLGDVVKIIGRLSEYNNYRYIFISKINKEHSGSTSFLSTSSKCNSFI